ncbi:uncharacterized protein LOC144322332 [Canis aureus]
MLMGLPMLGDICFKFTNNSSDNQNSTARKHHDILPVAEQLLSTVPEVKCFDPERKGEPGRGFYTFQFLISTTRWRVSMRSPPASMDPALTQGQLHEATFYPSTLLCQLSHWLPTTTQKQVCEVKREGSAVEILE